VLLAILDSAVDELGVLLLLGRGENQGRVGGRILGVVLGNGREVAGVADDSLQRGMRQQLMAIIWCRNAVFLRDRTAGRRWGTTYRASGLELIERAGHGGDGIFKGAVIKNWVSWMLEERVWLCLCLCL
jgi:hypothetical protein